MPRLTADRRLLRRIQIRDAALRCFATLGFADTSMSDIVAESGLSAGSIYSHFTSKAELLRFAVEDILHQRLATVASRVTPSAGIQTPSDLLALLLDEPGLLPPDRAGLLLQVWAQVPFDAELRAFAYDAALQVRTFLVDSLVPWAMERSGNPAAAEAASDAVLAAMHGFVVRLVLTPPEDHDALRSSIVAGIAALTG